MSKRQNNKGYILFSIIMLAWIFFATLILVCFGIMFLNGDMEYIRNMNNIE